MKILKQEDFIENLKTLTDEVEADWVVLWDKSGGMTSHDVVARVRRMVREARQNFSGEAKRRLKVGHAGTLDPLATGLLILLIGKATKRQMEFMKLDKEYVVEGVLGLVSDTYDVDGQVTIAELHRSVSEEELRECAAQFVGVIDQRVPAFSAIKREGKKLYELARKGQIVESELPVRQVTISELALLDWEMRSVRDVVPSVVIEENLLLPWFRLKVHCSSGTYIRSLVHDIGQRLGTGAVVTSLRRTTIGSYELTAA